MRNASIATILITAGILASCGSSSPRTERAPGVAVAPPQTPAPETPQSDPEPSVTGIELTLLTLDDKGARVAAALAPYDTDPPEGIFDSTEHAGWRAWGFRWIAVPIEELDVALGSQRPTRPIETRDMGTFPRWQPLIRTGELKNIAVRSPGAVSRLLSGRPRLLARSWSTPIIEDGMRRNAVKLDLALQMAIRPDSERDLITPVRATSEYARGELLGPGLMTLTVRPSHALVLVAESPDTRWAVADDGSGVAFRPDPDLGPGARRARSIGEVMLSRSGSNPLKVLVVLTPKAAQP